MFDKKTLRLRIHKRDFEGIQMFLDQDRGRKYASLEHFLVQAVLEKLEREVPKQQIPQPRWAPQQWRKETLTAEPSPWPIKREEQYTKLEKYVE